MNKNFTPLVDEHLQSLANMQEAQTDDFFYARLKNRIESLHDAKQNNWSLPLKPVWIISMLVFLLGINGLMLLQQKRNAPAKNEIPASLQSFAQAYDQTVSSSY